MQNPFHDEHRPDLVPDELAEALSESEPILGPLGISEREERLYRALLAAPDCPTEVLSSKLGLSAADVEATLGLLAEKRLAVLGPHGYDVAPPDVAVEALIQQRRAVLEGTRAAVSQLATVYRNGAGRAGRIQLFRGAARIRELAEQIQRSAREEIIGMARPPWFLDGVNDVQMSMAQRGAAVSFRGIYDRAVLHEAEGLGIIGMYGEQGERIRVFDHVPLKMMMVDRSIAMLSFPELEAHHDPEPAVLFLNVHALVHALAEVFEALWRVAVPLPIEMGESGALPRDLVAEHRLLLSLLRAGLTDEAIAKRLTVSRRTVVRYIRQLMDLSGTQTRFQLGWKAAELGWVGEHR